MKKDKVEKIIKMTEKEFLDRIDEAFAEGIRSVKHPEKNFVRGFGQWEWSLANNGWADTTCNKCGWTWNDDIHVHWNSNYCPNCGRRMKRCGVISNIRYKTVK